MHSLLYASAASTASSTRSSTSSYPSLVFFLPLYTLCRALTLFLFSLPRTFPYSMSLLASCTSSLIPHFLFLPVHIAIPFCRYLQRHPCVDAPLSLSPSSLSPTARAVNLFDSSVSLYLIPLRSPPPTTLFRELRPKRFNHIR